jgi:hypothetical protein
MRQVSCFASFTSSELLEFNFLRPWGEGSVNLCPDHTASDSDERYEDGFWVCKGKCRPSGLPTLTLRRKTVMKMRMTLLSPLALGAVAFAALAEPVVLSAAEPVRLTGDKDGCCHSGRRRRMTGRLGHCRWLQHLHLKGRERSSQPIVLAAYRGVLQCSSQHRWRASGENLLDFFMALFSQTLELPYNPARFHTCPDSKSGGPYTTKRESSKGRRCINIDLPLYSILRETGDNSKTGEISSASRRKSGIS